MKGTGALLVSSVTFPLMVAFWAMTVRLEKTKNRVRRVENFFIGDDRFLGSSGSGSFLYKIKFAQTYRKF
jgi:hypothetical protein